MGSTWSKLLLYPALAAGLLLAPLGAAGGEAAYAAAVTTAATTKTAADIQILVDGEKIVLSAPIIKVNDVGFAPMQDLLDALGTASVYDKDTGKIIIRDSVTTITMEIGSKEAFVNNEELELDEAPMLKNGIPYVGIRFVAEELGAKVEWDADANAIAISIWDGYQDVDGATGEEDDSYYYWYEPEEIADAYDASVVMIMTNAAQGSGTVVGDNLILTNYHVMADATSATAYTTDGDELKIVGVVASDEDADLAIIRTEKSTGLTPVELTSDYYAAKGARIYAIGSPDGFQNTISTGIIGNLLYEAGVSYVQFNAPIGHGSSGGALFNEYGEFIGITTSGVEKTNASINFAVSAYQADELLDSVTKLQIAKAAFLPPSLPDTLVGAPLSKLEELLKDQFGSVQTSDGMAAFTDWKAARDSEGWLNVTAVIDPVFYLYYGFDSENEIRNWSINLGYELHRMLPNERIDLAISFNKEYSFMARGFASGEVTSSGNGKWRVNYKVIDMQIGDDMYITSRF
ncbi:trypsin-like peptidase domain-containing protein [Paenibacillus sp. HB172176]|uniref:trypsin-like peptidase domain-containing protein n=1 Tax=Paenibacillus sp. HB172176 TaxID=2493690 RepID=UPI001439CC71|nr:trypsin-like peptidase domain-containing protein [Paenibacillus sp. HB172176]